MRPLRTCDFCDADALGTFDVVPPELEPTEAERRRAVLCQSCKQRLEVLLEPLVARASAASSGESGAAASAGADPASSLHPDQESDDGTSADTGDDESGVDSHPHDTPGRDPQSLEAVDAETVGAETVEPESTESGSVVASADESTEKRRRRRRPNASVTSTTEPANTDETEAADETARADTADGRSDSIEPGNTDETRDPEPVDETAGITFDEDATSEREQTGHESGATSGTRAEDPVGSDETDGRDDATGRGNGPDAEPVGNATSSESADETDGSNDDDSNESNDEPTRASASGVERRTVAKVIRLLQNRELPIERDAAEELAASAYDLEGHEVTAIVDRTLERGEFLEQGGELHRA